MSRLCYKTLKFNVETTELCIPVRNARLDLTFILEKFHQDQKYLLDSETRSASLVNILS